MMTSTANTSALSDTLHQITLIKIAELDKKREIYSTKKKGALAVASVVDVDALSRTRKLAENISRVKVPNIDNHELKNIFDYVKQAAFDPSVPGTEISRYEQWLLANLDYQSNRLDHSALFSAVLSEHLDRSSETSSTTSETGEDDSSLDGSFEMLTKDRLQQLREKFEDVVFNEFETDEQAIHSYLQSLFATEDLKSLITGLQDRLKNDTTAIFTHPAPFDDDVLDWVIRGLLHNDLLRDDQKTLLKNFRQDDLVRAELCDVLNMRWAELKTWQWTEDGDGLDVEPRKQLNGKYRVVMQEDVLQSMLVHYIGVKLCVNAKEELKYWLDRLMIPDCSIPQEERDVRKFYLNHAFKEPGSYYTLQSQLQTTYWDDIFLSQLPNSVKDTGGYDDEDDDSKDTTNNKKSWLQIKQQLLHHIASKILIDRKVYDDVAVVQTDLQWFATSIPHSTVYAVLKFCGLTDKWITWFRAYLEVPLNMTKAAGGEQEIRKRKRGIPISHALEKYLGEMILVFLDIAVKREADLLLYRMHDDIMLCGPTAQCEKAWATMQKFVQIMGLEFNNKKTGSISLNATSSKKAQLPDGDVAVDFLKLSSDQGLWVIDNDQVDAHIKQLKKQLDESEDILSFVRTYNSCIGRFFGHTFGLPAHCLGHKHVKDILHTHHRIQEELFGQDGVTAVLKEKLQSLLKSDESLPDLQITDSFIHNPILLGGLGVTNPFIPLLLVASDLSKTSPDQRVADFLEDEKKNYGVQKRLFEYETLSSRKKRRTKILENDKLDEDDEEIFDLDNFFSFEEYIKNREWTSPQLLNLYNSLVASPEASPVNVSTRVKEDLKRLTAEGAKQVSFDELTTEEKYKVQMFSDEMFKTFGTVGIVDRELAPLGVMKAVMGEKVTWQMVL